MRVRYKSPKNHGIITFDDDATLENLSLQLFCELGTDKFSLKYGWPPKDLDLADRNVSLASLKLNGETLTVVLPEEHNDDKLLANTQPGQQTQTSGSMWGRPASPPRAAAQTGPIDLARKPPVVPPDDMVVPWPAREGVMVLRVMPDDNSCLFTAFGGVIHKPDASTALRKEIASFIQSHPEVYSEVVLEMTPSRYCTLLQDPDRWGGAIELGILSQLYDIEICSVDVKSGRIDKYRVHEDQQSQECRGQDNKDSQEPQPRSSKPVGGSAGTAADGGSQGRRFCVLVYSGIHYDRIAFSLSDPPFTSTNLPAETDVTSWFVADEHDTMGEQAAVLDKASELVGKLRAMHYYTDMTELVMKCEVPGCGWVGLGERGAAAHMRETGHANMSEIEVE